MGKNTIGNISLALGIISCLILFANSLFDNLLLALMAFLTPISSSLTIVFGVIAICKKQKYGTLGLILGLIGLVIIIHWAYIVSNMSGPPNM